MTLLQVFQLLKSKRGGDFYIYLLICFVPLTRVPRGYMAVHDDTCTVLPAKGNHNPGGQEMVLGEPHTYTCEPPHQVFLLHAVLSAQSPTPFPSLGFGIAPRKHPQQ